jgi:hypothetical protein
MKEQKKVIRAINIRNVIWIGNIWLRGWFVQCVAEIGKEI